jgi:hypothetical protein
MERMEQTVPDTNEQALQHFISNSPWDAEAVMRQVARGADTLLGGHDDTLLVIDKSGIPKKGKHSAGLARQYCGHEPRNRPAVIDIASSGNACSPSPADILGYELTGKKASLSTSGTPVRLTPRSVAAIPATCSPL